MIALNVIKISDKNISIAKDIVKSSLHKKNIQLLFGNKIRCSSITRILVIPNTRMKT